MSILKNLAVKLCGVLQAESSEEISAREWRLLGQEQDGSQILSWMSTKEGKELYNIGIYTNKTKSLKTLHTFAERINIIQASVNASHSALVYVTKSDGPTQIDDQHMEQFYRPYLLLIQSRSPPYAIEVQEGSSKQIMVQYLYGKSLKYSPGVCNDRFILFTHLECIKVYKSTLRCAEPEEDGTEWELESPAPLPPPDVIVKVFSWAQWDCINQVLYYIHYRQPTLSFAEGEEVKSPSEITPTLSALQFHADLPHETVLNIPLSLPQLPGGGGGAGGGACGQYEDDPLPLRVHDCSLDLQVVSDPSGIVCICHHYLYKPLDESVSSLVLEDSAELKESGVNFAYSITLLHHGLVVHSVVPDLPWSLAKSLRPSYTLYGNDNHLLVKIPMLLTHLLDVGLQHEPCCHAVLPAAGEVAARTRRLAPLAGWGPGALVDLATLDVLAASVEQAELVAAFRSDAPLVNKLAIVHYVVQHEGNAELADELVSWMCVNQQRDVPGAFERVMQEYLVGTAHAATRRSLPAAAAPLARLLPLTLLAGAADVKVGEVCVSVSQERLWNTSVVLLAPRQRLAQFSEDLWTRLWGHLAAAPATPPAAQRFKCSQVLDKLRVSLDCYQPEALSRCTTPMSPGAAAPTFPGAPARRSSLAPLDLLPFLEVDICTASKQEHIIAANLREMSMHLLRSAAGGGAGGGGAGGGGAGARRACAESAAVHAVATRWAATQLDASRALCRAVSRAVAAAPAHHQHRGFAFIDDMEERHAAILFRAYEQYYLAADALAFPLPQGFTAFFTYLGYRTLPFSSFLQYVHRNVFELQIHVVKAIVVAKEDGGKRSVDNKLRLIQLIGDGRARRALAAWPHRAALVLCAREHAATLLSGHAPAAGARDVAASAATGAHRTHQAAQRKGIAAFPSGERLSPLDTFLDLLTAKASLNELDFNLIIEATLAGVHGD